MKYVVMAESDGVRNEIIDAETNELFTKCKEKEYEKEVEKEIEEIYFEWENFRLDAKDLRKQVIDFGEFIAKRCSFPFKPVKKVKK